MAKLIRKEHLVRVNNGMAFTFSKLKISANNKALFGILMSSLCQMSLAQDGSADLLNLNLEDLFCAEFEEIEPTNKLPRGAQRWRFQAKYQQSEFDGINIGSEKCLQLISFSNLAWRLAPRRITLWSPPKSIRALNPSP